MSGSTISSLTPSSDETVMKAASLRAQELREIATRRWLTKDELCFLLVHSSVGYLPTYPTVQLRPASGSLFFYDSTKVSDYKKDNWTWQQRKDNSGRVREDRAKLVINRAVVILGTYVHSAEIPTFHRRSYYFRDTNPHILLVHYFDEVNKSEFKTNGVKRALPSSNTPSKSLVTPPLSPPSIKLGLSEQETIMNECFAMDYYLPSMSSTDLDPSRTPLHLQPLEDESFSDWTSFIHHTTPTTETDKQIKFELGEISDYAPDWDFISGGAKILICLVSSLPQHWCEDSKRLIVRFTSSMERLCVKADRIAETVIRCAAPQATMAGAMELELCACTADTCIPLTTKRRFMYKEAIVSLPTVHTNGSLPAMGKRGRSPIHSMIPRQPTRTVPSTLEEHGPTTIRRPYLLSRRGSNPDSAPLSAFVDTELDERQCKIRVVERLTEFQDAIRTTTTNSSELLPPVTKPTSPASPVSPSPISVDSSISDTLGTIPCDDQEGNRGLLSLALDDGGAIEKLSDQELESLSETLLERVVIQLISVAHASEELLDELNSLDETGLSLLHYVSFYNYAHLIPVLLSHGAHVNQQSTQGYTPLHLAAGCGHEEVVRALVEADADVFLVDFDGFTPAERAENSGNVQVASYLKRLMTDSLSGDASDWFETLAMEIDQDDGDRHTEHSPWSPEKAEPLDPNLCNDMDLEMDCSGSSSGDGVVKSNYVDENQEHNRKFLLGAFSTMSLHDKCALSLSISSRRRGSSFAEDSGGLLPMLSNGHSSSSNVSSPSKTTAFDIGSSTVTSLSSGENDSICDSDVKSVIAEDEASFYKLEAAMELMGPEELQSLEEEARVIQHNVRAWLLRRNCRNMRETTKQLHEAAKSMKVSEEELMSRQLLSERERAAVTVQAAARTMLARKSFLQTRNVTIRVQAATRGVICRKNFARMKTHALASLVIQRNVREWLSKQPGGSTEKSNGTTESLSSPLLMHKLPPVDEQEHDEMDDELTRMLMDSAAA